MTKRERREARRKDREAAFFQKLHDRSQWYRNIYLSSPHWQRLRKERLAVSPVCEDCGSKESLQVHHVIYRKLWDCTVSDLRTICRACHDRRHLNRAKAEAKMRAMNWAFDGRYVASGKRQAFQRDLVKRRRAEVKRLKATPNLVLLRKGKEITHRAINEAQTPSDQVGLAKGNP
jgi:hypothetical protein